MWQLHSLRFQDEESDGAYSDLDLKTNGSDPDYKPLSSEEMCSFGQDINISDIISLSSPELHVPFYEWRIVVRVTYLRVKVCNCQICFVSLWRMSGPIPKIRDGLTKEFMVHYVFPVELRWIYILARNVITWSAWPSLSVPRMLIGVGFCNKNTLEMCKIPRPT